MTTNIFQKDVDILVIGGGIAGTFAAIKAKEAGVARVVQVDKGHVGRSGSSAFAAGIMYVPFPEDSFLNEWFASEVVNSGYLLQQDRVKEHFEQAYNLAQEMQHYGVDFLKGPQGQLERHSGRGKYPALLFPGPQLMRLTSQACLNRGVEQINRIMVTNFLTHGNRVTGATGFNTRTGDFYIFKAKVTILATGLTKYKGLSPGHRDCTGDGFYAAYQAGATLSSAESNTSNYNSYPALYDLGPGTSVYIGQGARFLNVRGERFMEKYDPVLKERVPMGMLANALGLEARQGKAPIYLDMTHFTTEQIERLEKVLPVAMKMFKKVGLVKDGKFTRPIDWMITAPYGRPGLRVNSRFESSIPGLFACGEAAATQSYSNNLICAATSGATTGKAAAAYIREVAEPIAQPIQIAEIMDEIFKPWQRKDGMEPDQVILSLLETVVPYDVLLLRHANRMGKALQEVESIRDTQVPLLFAYDPHYLRLSLEARNMVFVAELQLKSAIRREESRLSLREDYPYMDNINWLKWVNIQQQNGKMVILTEEIPLSNFTIKPVLEKKINPMWEIAQDCGIVKINQGELVWQG